MNYEVKGNILGFEQITNVNIVEIDELFSTMKDSQNNEISFTIIKPYTLREYSFDIPTDTKVLLDLKDDSMLSVYNIVVIQNPLENSVINFLAPIIVNHDNNKIAQVLLDPKKYSNYGMRETIKSFRPEQD